MKRNRIRTCIACVLVLALCMTGCAGRCANDPESPTEIVTSTDQPSTLPEETTPVTEDQVLPGGSGGEPALATAPAETAPPAAATPVDTDDPLEIEIPEDTPAGGGETKYTPAPTLSNAGKQTQNPGPVTTATPSAAQTPAASPTAHPSDGDIELPELP